MKYDIFPWKRTNYDGWIIVSKTTDWIFYCVFAYKNKKAAELAHNIKSNDDRYVSKLSMTAYHPCFDGEIYNEDN